MALRTMTNLRRMMSGISANGSHSYATSTTTPIKTSSVKKKGDFVPVYVVLGMIMLSLSFGAHTALHQLTHSPNVHVSKKKREELPEVEEPEYVVDEANKFRKKSFFRKVAHIQDHFHQDEVIPKPKGDIYTRPVKVETLKPVELDLVGQ